MEQRKALNQTKAQVKRGDSSATFPVKLPRWAGEDALNTKCWGTPEYLVASRTNMTVPRIRYIWQYYFRIDQPRYPFVVKTVMTINRTASSIGDRLATHMERVSEAFPLQLSVPYLYYDTSDENDPHFALRLPPKSCMVSNHELFFAGLGFLPDIEGVDAPQDGQFYMGGRGRRTKMTRTWGFSNEKPTKNMNFRGVTMGPNVFMDAVSGAAETEFPKEMQVQAELFEVTQDHTPRFVYLDGGVRADANVHTAITAFEALAEKVKQYCNFKFNMIDVSSDGKQEMTMTNRAVIGSGVTIVIIFDNEISDVFDMPRRRSHIFNLETIRSYYFKFPDPQIDPLTRYYPMSLISVEVGEAKSWIEGRGYVPLTAVMRDKRTMISTGAAFNVNQSHLTFDFIDSSGEKIVFQQDLQLDLLLKFVRQ